MKKTTAFFKNLWKDESAQGATEYILLLIVVVGLVMLFKDKIKSIVQTKIGNLGDSINSVNSQ
jgi:hypothetical protein